MEYKLTRLDGRHSGAQWFKYYAAPVVPDTWLYANKWTMEQRFLEWQAWCWDTYGQGTQRDWNHHIQNDAVWAWQTERVKAPRLYLRGDRELMLFQLRWS